MDGRGNNILPEINVKGSNLVSDRCVWCFEEVELTKSHLFPESMGGRFSPFLTCNKCNNFIGQKIESTVKRNVYFTAAISACGLASKREAFRHAKIIDEESGLEFNLSDKGGAIPKPQKTEDGWFAAPKDISKKMRLSQFRKLRPNSNIGPLADFLDSTEKESLSYEGLLYSQRSIPGKNQEFKIVGLTRDPAPDFIFKIIYEFCWPLGLMYNKEIYNKMVGAIRLNRIKGDERIVINKDIHQYIFSNTFLRFESISRRFEDLPFSNWHAIILRLSKKLNIYFEIVFFGYFRSFLILGNMNECYNDLIPYFDRPFMFPFNSPFFVDYDYPQLRFKRLIMWSDSAVDLRIDGIFQKARDYFNRKK